MKCTPSSDSTEHEDAFLNYVAQLEERLTSRSDELEEVHMEAAIDAMLIHPRASETETEVGRSKVPESPLFSDYTNPDAVANCLSPYVPTKAERIVALLRFARLKPEDVLLDVGSGDGRVCVAASKLTGCRSIGVDLSPPCIRMARQLIMAEGGGIDCEFVECDATASPRDLLADGAPLHSLRDVTCIVLYTYPTLLQALVPLLHLLSNEFKARRIITLSYHLDEEIAHIVDTDEKYDLRMYESVRCRA